MKSLDYYERLPDSMRPEELRDEFMALLRAPPGEGEQHTMVQALFELADRQWHSYEPLAPDLRDALSERILELWSDTDAERARWCLGVIAHVGLGDALRSLASRAPASLHPAVRRELEEALSEFGGSVDDPWVGLGDRSSDPGPERPET